MSQIKSTLDLVMEKTRHLTMTEDEKKASKKLEIKTTISGLIQKYRDKIYKRQELLKEIDMLKQKSDGFDISRVMKEEILSNLKIDEDNTCFFDILSGLYKTDTSAMKSICESYEREKKDICENTIIKMNHFFHQKLGLSGEALIPNPDTDKNFINEINQARRKFEKKLEKQKLNFIN